MAGKIYALSDLHGNFEILLAMLEKIHFDDRDMLYILGDCNDRGEKAMEIYRFIQRHSDHMILLKGNHELMMRDFFLKEEDWDCPRGRLWKSNGGMKTLEQMEAFLRRDCVDEKDFCDKWVEFRRWLTDYIDHLPVFLEINVGGQGFILIHAGIDPSNPLEKQEEEICAWVREWFYLSPAIKGKTIVFGHTPLSYINNDGSLDVWFDPVHQDKIGIDGGVGPFDYGQLNCICLNDLSVNVVKKEEIYGRRSDSYDASEKEEA